MSEAVWIVHICAQADWRAAQAQGVYRPSSLAQEGFIHFSRPDQAVATANRYYAGQGGLVLLWVDTAQLQGELRWEASGQEFFPHLYGPLDCDAVSASTDFPPDPDGVFRSLPQRPNKP
jgi:uncharacterized protein (DUF952 family)